MVEQFEQYFQRISPDSLKENASVPAAWTGSAESWEEFKGKAREYARSKAYHDFTVAIGEQGYTAQELALDLPVETDQAGRVYRREPAQDRQTLLDARQAASALQETGVSIDPIQQARLDRAADGAYAGPIGSVRAAIEAAKAAVQQHYAGLKAEAEKQRNMALLRVHSAFKAKGKNYVPGEYRIPLDEAQGLHDWEAHHEATRRQHGWTMPEGFAVWPVFTIESAATVPS